jgi:hypothetical protein
LEYLWVRDNFLKVIDVERLKKATDFSVLKVLRIGQYSIGETLRFLATQCQFSSLTELELVLGREDYR